MQDVILPESPKAAQSPRGRPSPDPARRDQCALDDVLQLPDVAGPIVGHEAVELSLGHKVADASGLELLRSHFIAIKAQQAAPGSFTASTGSGFAAGSGQGSSSGLAKQTA